MEENSTKILEHDKRRVVEVFAAGMTHDLNNIISAIVGYTELSLTSEHLPTQVRDNLQQLQQATRTAREFIHQLSLISGRGLEARCIHMDICPVIHDSLRMQKKSTPPNIEIRILVPDMLDEIQMEPSLMQLLMLNLCQNAVQAMIDSGGVLQVSCEKITRGVEVETTATDELTPFLKLTVSDTGVGMQADVLPYIYDPYFSTKGKGKGLGLAIVKGIVSGLGGEISVDSQPGKGSCFDLYFPC